ncbi:RsmB/NOP family class I SAM-dependent RNA methyltransferase [Thioclava sp. FR2]|uniref:RsmB/NOP family class I SAM-dependent RNA methyltransferase n=1 Tax=Thioclava sp. FR2 TaxID=3445780 RepID=UPI003EC01DFA
MTPAARISAAIDVLDKILAGQSAEHVLTAWGRSSRFAGSGDRAAVRDLVYDALRCRRSFAALGGGETGRHLILGGLRAAGQDGKDIFTGEGYAPAPVGPSDAGREPDDVEEWDLPDWLIPKFQASLGEQAFAIAQSLQQRAPVFLRVNLGRCRPDQAIRSLAEDQIVAVPHPLASSALEVTSGQRKIQNCRAYLSGQVELQDAASQAVIEMLPLKDGMKVLDHCAGGGGKTLAMAARAKLGLFAHDISPRRMKDLPERAKRAGIKVTLTETPERNAPYDLVLADVPCSGSGSWRRDPQGKWSLNEKTFSDLLTVQAGILDRISAMVSRGGTLAYATCSVLSEENSLQIRDFLERSPQWRLVAQRQFTPLDGGDGFFVAYLTQG